MHTGVALVLVVLVFPTLAFAQTQQREHRIVYSAGWAGDASRGDGFQPAGAEGGFEITPIENRLSIETTVGVHHGDEGTEMHLEVAFRKPWQLSRTVEFMAGVAPTLVHTFGASGESFGAISAGGHFMVWPSPNLGWYAESAYEVGFPTAGAHKGVEFSGGILIGH
jgi:hypothetical protein